jgi:hypothetical protein
MQRFKSGATSPEFLSAPAATYKTLTSTPSHVSLITPLRAVAMTTWRVAVAAG